MSTPVRDSTSASLSANGSPSRRARARPTAVLPEPIGPIKKTLRFVGCKRGLSPLAPRHYGQHRPFAKGDCPLLVSPPPSSRQRGLSPPPPPTATLTPKGRVPFGKGARPLRKRNGRPKAAVGMGSGPPRSLDRGTLAQDLRRHEDQQLVAVVDLALGLEQVADHRHVAEARDLLDRVAPLRLHDAAQHDRLAVLHEHLGLDVARVDR